MVGMERSRSNVAVCCVLAMAVAACSSAKGDAAESAPRPLLPGIEPVEHPVHSEDLLRAMHSLEGVALDGLASEPDTVSDSDARLAELQEIGETIAVSALSLPGVLDRLDLPAESERRFRELADRLQAEAISLRDRAAAGDVDSVRDEREAILATCNACHDEFRILPESSTQP
jgi:cytochrome c553